MSKHRSLTLFFFNDTATTEIYTLSLHDALPIFSPWTPGYAVIKKVSDMTAPPPTKTFVLLDERDDSINDGYFVTERSEEHTSELQSLAYLVCRLLLEKKKNVT